MPRFLTVASGVMIVFAACTSTSTAIRDPGHKDRNYSKALVFGNFHGLALRKEAETTVVAKLKMAHIDAAPSLDYAITLDPAVKQKIVDAGFDCVLEVSADDPNAAIVHTNVNARIRDLADGSTVWQDQIEARSATNWPIQATVIDGMEKVAEDVISSGIFSKKSKPAPKPSTTTI
jgi:hypothetical protein